MGNPSSLSPALPWNLANAKWSASLNPLINNPLNQASVLTNIQLQPGTNVINHMLGKTMQGWFLVDVQASVQPALNINLSVSATVPAFTPIKYDTIFEDTLSSYNPATGEYTVPVDGLYEVSAIFDSTSFGVSAILYKNGIIGRIIATIATASVPAGGATTIECLAQDTLTINVNNTVSVTGVASAPFVNAVSITLLSAKEPIYRNGPFNDKTLSLFSNCQTTVSIGVF